MYGSVLSVLLMGLLPMAGAPSADHVALGNLSIAAPLPLTASSSTLHSLATRVSASGMLITDLESAQSILELRADVRRPMGSLTKLMTALLIAEGHGMRETVTVPEGIERVQGSVVSLRAGERYAVGDLLSLLLVASANDVAHTFAVFHSGSDDAFAQEMNVRAAALGLRNTSYANPSGFDDPEQWSTPRDLAWLASFVLRNAQVRKRLSLPAVTVRSAGGRTLTVHNTHALLQEPGPVVAGKTGTTEEAGQCLLSVVREGRREYVVVLLGSLERYADMRLVLEALRSFLV
ncbi:MAG: serine hydrolase [Candidatus Peribacteraceae bacterium]|nr:serine hydrolase [Candidatus Peribacteraceae bacterium]